MLLVVPLSGRMGSEASKDITPSEMNDLKSCTAFSGNEIREMYKSFHQDCPSGVMSKESFMQVQLLFC